MVNRRLFLKAAAAGGAAAWAGNVLAADAAAVRGRVIADGKGMAGVVVTDGLNCVETAADGSWSLPAREGVRFISVTPPSGWRVPCHYIRFAGAGSTYDFELLPWPAFAPVDADALRLVVTEAWGDAGERAHVFALDVL